MERTGDYLVLDPLEAPCDAPGAMPTVSEFLDSLEASHLLAPGEPDVFLARHPELRDRDTPALVESLVDHGLLSDYQASRLLAGRTFGLVIGNYRVIDRIGVGGMGVVYKAEHVHMKRTVALKILFLEDDQNPVFLERFRSEMEAMAVLRHPNIALAFDAGEVTVPHAPNRVLRYLVMEFVAGQNLEQLVQERGPLPIVQACDLVRQAACGLRHAHEHGLVHRDVKPSNLLLTPEGQIKLLDFGLARLCRRRCTEAHAMLGTVDYMAPEQARDARSVDIRADIYGLGGILYWLLAGERPFPGDRSAVEELLARQHELPVPLRRRRPDVPLELEAIVCQMMAREPSDRYPTPLALITALNAFLEAHTDASTAASSDEDAIDTDPHSRLPHALPALPVAASATEPRAHRVLVVSERTVCRNACRKALEPEPVECLEAVAAAEASDCLGRSPCDLVVVDAQLPGGEAFCRLLRRQSSLPRLKLALVTSETMSERDADWHFHVTDWEASSSLGNLRSALVNLLRLKETEERADTLATHLLRTNHQIEQAFRVHHSDAYQAQDVLIFALAKMAESRGAESGAHLLRMQQYVRVLAEEAIQLPGFAGLVDSTFVRAIERCVVLHDIGKVAIPDHVLLEPGRLDPEERLVMESHAVVGAGILQAVARRHGAALAFLPLAIDIARHHHERWDGTGYPDGLAGDSIPLAARLTTIADVYDALRSKRAYKPGLAHAAARRLLLDTDKSQFDPALLVAFRRCENSFEQVFEQTED